MLVIFLEEIVFKRLIVKNVKKLFMGKLIKKDLLGLYRSFIDGRV